MLIERMEHQRTQCRQLDDPLSLNSSVKCNNEVVSVQTGVAHGPVLELCYLDLAFTTANLENNTWQKH